MSKEVDDEPLKRHKSGFHDIHSCSLFPSGFDFKNVCSCNECSSMIGQLKEFEKDLKSKSKQVSECRIKMSDAKDNCFYLAATSGWSVELLEMLLHNLKVAHVELGLTFSTFGEILREMNETDLLIQRVITDKGFFLGINDVDDPNEKETYPSKIINHHIGYGLHLYNKTKVKEEAHSILNEVSSLERMHEAAQISAEEKDETLDPLISKSYIEQQIECVKRLPVKELISEVEDEIDSVSHITRNTKKLSEARSYIIDDVSSFVVKTRRLFWQEYEEKHKGETGHDSTGLEVTLQILSDKANLFKDRWTKDYAHWVAPYERLDPKMQRAQ